MSLHIIACGVFSDALQQIDPRRFYRNITLSYTDPCLHNYPVLLLEEIKRQIQRAKIAGDRIVCLYGHCAPDLDPLLQEMGVTRVPGAHCYEMLLGSRSFQRIVDEEPGTYFIEKNLVLNFSEYCSQPLELDDPLMRKSYFQHYTRLAYIRQPLDPDTVMPGVHAISQFLELKPFVIDSDYSELESNLLKLFAD